MYLPDPSEATYEVGEVVWFALPGLGHAGRGWGCRPRRGTVREVHGDDDYLIELRNGRHRWCFANELRPYEAIDRLADLVRCTDCGHHPADCTCSRFTTVASNTVGTAFTVTIGGTIASNLEPIPQLGDLVREPERQPLSAREWHRRQRRSRLAKRSRRRNR